MCGAGANPELRGFDARGSSPRVWGRLAAAALGNVRPGFIPTCVGQAQYTRVNVQKRKVHPHVCGAGSSPARIGFIPRGSSPRVWGRRSLYGRRWRMVWFIPTCVGQARAGGRRPFAGSVHPHVCGAGALPNSHALQFLGSSPRVWGRLRFKSHLSIFARFIPTCVGQAEAYADKMNTIQVHPHVCGAGYGWGLGGRRTGGSSPRVWGRLNTTGV